MARNGSAIVSIGLGAAILYLGAHAVTGRQGLVAFVDLQAQERALEAQLAALESERDALEARAARLEPGPNFDHDYLEERARVLLAAHSDDDLVFAIKN
jgi:cell division protein FtsB